MGNERAPLQMIYPSSSFYPPFRGRAGPSPPTSPSCGASSQHHLEDLASLVKNIRISKKHKEPPSIKQEDSTPKQFPSVFYSSGSDTPSLLPSPPTLPSQELLRPALFHFPIRNPEEAKRNTCGLDARPTAIKDSKRNSDSQEGTSDSQQPVEPELSESEKENGKMSLDKGKEKEVLLSQAVEEKRDAVNEIGILPVTNTFGVTETLVQVAEASGSSLTTCQKPPSSELQPPSSTSEFYEPATKLEFDSSSENKESTEESGNMENSSEEKKVISNLHGKRKLSATKLDLVDADEKTQMEQGEVKNLVFGIMVGGCFRPKGDLLNLGPEFVQFLQEENISNTELLNPPKRPRRAPIDDCGYPFWEESFEGGDLGDELSFLVEKIEVTRERNDGFMPYLS